MHCHKHTDRKAAYYCSKYNRYLCEECLNCQDPTLYCKSRTSCMVWEVVKHGSPDEQSNVEAEVDCSNPAELNE